MLSLVQVMACHLFGAKPLQEAIKRWSNGISIKAFFQENTFENVVCNRSAIVFSDYQDKSSRSSDAYMRPWTRSTSII